MIRTAIAAALLLLPLWAGPASAERTVAGVSFAERVRAGDATLELCSAALLRWKGLLKVYVAGLYLPGCQDPERALSMDGPRRLEIAYLRGFDGSQFAKAAETVLERTFPADRLAPLRERIERLHGAYRSVESGDRYTLTYLPGVGTELALNGRRLAVAPGDDFADAYFAIWLGPRPADEGLRDELLEPTG